MQGLGAVGIIFTGLISAVLATWTWWKFIGRGMAAERARRERLALFLNPVYRQKVEEDRKHQLAWANLALLCRVTCRWDYRQAYHASVGLCRWRSASRHLA